MRLTLGSSQFSEGGSGEMVLRDEKERIRLARLSRTPRTRSRLLLRRRDAPFVRVDKFVFFTRTFARFTLVLSVAEQKARKQEADPNHVEKKRVEKKAI